MLVGMPYLHDAPAALDALLDEVDLVEVTPESLCHERVGPTGPELALRAPLLAELLARCGGKEVLVHGVELSIASVGGWDPGCLDLTDRIAAACPFAWHSEHLSFLRVEGPDGTVRYTGVPLPPRCTREAIEVIAPRVHAVRARFGRPFLLEHGVHLLPDPAVGGELDEPTFLNELMEASGCGLLLDLYNLHCNAVNHGFDARAWLDRVRLDRVMEIHVAGGATHDGFLLDSHSAVVPEPVWELLAYVLPRAPGLRAVLYELLGAAVPVVGVEGIRAQLRRLQRAVGRA